MSTPARWRRFTPDYSPPDQTITPPKENGFLLVCRGGGDFLGPQTTAVAGDTVSTVPAGMAWESGAGDPLPEFPAYTVGTLGDRTVFMKPLPAEFPAPEGYEWVNLRSFIAEIDTGTYEAFARAGILASWDRENRYCGRCGSETKPDAAEHALVCPSCGLRAYPRVTPAMIVRITDGNRILLARNRRFPEDLYSCVAGYVDPGENLEVTVRREVVEEVGLEVRRIRYFSSQSWPFPHSLMVAFTATSSGTPTPDGEEIVDARWFTRGNLPRLPMPGSISRRMVDAWLRRGDVE